MKWRINCKPPLPSSMNVRDEGAATLELYGADPDKPVVRPGLLAGSPMVERAVRFVKHHHEDGTPTATCRATTKRIAVTPPRRGGAHQTLQAARPARRNAGRPVSRRTPMIENNTALGPQPGAIITRRPSPFGWPAGSRRGTSMVKRTSSASTSCPTRSQCFYHLQATILHQLGLDHERLTYRYAGRDFRLTDVHHSG